MVNIKEIATQAFLEGSDNFGEKPTGIIKDITYSKLAKQYLVRLQLMYNDNICYTEIGLVPNDLQYKVISGHEVFSVDITKELQEELSEAIITEI